MIKRFNFVLLTVVLVVGTSAGCNNNSKKDGPDYAELSKDFVTAVSQGEASTAVAGTVPGSPARAYATAMSYRDQAVTDGGEGAFQASTVTESEAGIKACSSLMPGECGTYSKFQFEGTKIKSFRLSEAEIAEVSSADPGTRAKLRNLGMVEGLGAYKNPDSGVLSVIVRITSPREKPVSTSYVAHYRGPDKRTSQSGDDYGARELGPDSATIRLFEFPNAEFGGEITVKVADSTEGSYDVAEGTVSTVGP